TRPAARGGRPDGAMGAIRRECDGATAQGHLPRVRAADGRLRVRGGSPLLRDRDAHPPGWRSQSSRSPLRRRPTTGADCRRHAGLSQLDWRKTMNPPIDVVTGAFSYSGRFVAAELLERGRGVRTLTNHPNPHDPLAARIPAQPLDFDDSAALVAALTGADTLYNTYWVRAPRVGVSHTVAVDNTKRLIDAARRAGIRRIVHTSIANPTSSRLSYYRGKAELEAAVRSSGLSYAIVRPTLLFGEGDVLINNIAWLLRHLPVFGIPGDGRYRLQPMHVRDHAALMVETGLQSEDRVVDSAGPEIFTFEDLVRLLRGAMGLHTLVLHMPASLAMVGA